MFGCLLPLRGGWPFSWGDISKILIGFGKLFSDDGVLPGGSFH